MRRKDKALQALLDQKLLPLFYHDDETTSVGILTALYDAGIRVVEYTNRGQNAADNFKAMRKAANKHMPGLLLGIGTIKTKKQAFKFIDAGADFVVCPTMNVDVAETVEKEELLWIPGCMTPTEVALAEETGATLVKIFPGNVLGPEYIRAIRELFPVLKFMPTGGVEAEENNLRQWFQSGVAGVGMGSKLIPKDMADNKNFEGLKNAAMQALQLVKKITEAE